MTQEFNAKKTQEFFDKLAPDFSMSTSPRDDIFFELILPKCHEKNNGKIKILDFGCGGGSFVLRMLERGIDAAGIEKHDNLCQLARERLVKAGFNKEKIIQGSIKELADLAPASFDFITIMGVFQYLCPDDYRQLLININSLLKPGGHLVCTFQNALFDLFTFNKYTVDFFENKFFKPIGLDKKFGKELVDDLKSLLANPDKPDFSTSIARDNIYVETANPLTIADQLKNYKFNLLEKYFYDFFFIPRLIEGKYKDRLKDLKNEFEIKRSTEWYGHFMANAFVVDCEKN